MSTTAEQQRQISPEVSDFLASGPHQAFVGGQEMASSSGATFTTHDPGSGEQLAEIHDLTAEDVDRAVEVGAKAFKETKEAFLEIARIADENEDYPVIYDIWLDKIG